MRKLRSREGRDSGGTGSKWQHCQTPHLCSPNLPVKASSSLWHQQSSAHCCQPDSMAPAANTGKRGLGRGGRAVKEAILEGGAGWHLCWIQKRGGRGLSSRQWPWGGRNPGVSARQEREAGGQGEGRRRCGASTEGSGSKRGKQADLCSKWQLPNPTDWLGPGQAGRGLQRNKEPFTPAVYKTWGSRASARPRGCVSIATPLPRPPPRKSDPELLPHAPGCW